MGSKINILKESILVETKQSNQAGMWNNFASKFSNFKNYLKYNVISTNKQLKFSELSYITLFDKSFVHNQFSCAEFNLALSKIFSFTYRTHFSDLLPKDGITFNSDCGWGCMIRAAQMMLSKAILEHKLFQLGKEVLLSQEEIFDLKINVLSLFFDNMINFEEKEFLDKSDFAFFFKNYTKILNEEEKKFNELNVKKFNFNEEIFREEDFQKEYSQNNLTVKGVFAPFSIQNVTKLGILYDAGPGVWFSDAKAIKIFKEIEEQLNVFNKQLYLFSFDSGVIYEKDLVEECFEEVKLECLKEFEECENFIKNKKENVFLENKNKQIKQNSINDGISFSAFAEINFDKANEKDKKDLIITENNHQQNVCFINDNKAASNENNILNLNLQTKISNSDKYENEKLDEGVSANLPLEKSKIKKANFLENFDLKNEFTCENICLKCLAKLQQSNKQGFSSELLEIDYYTNESESEAKFNNEHSSNFMNNKFNSEKTENKINLTNKAFESSYQTSIKKPIRRFYRLKKSGFIFVSVRHGLHSIETEYHRSIKQFFKIPYNLGIIGGKSNSAYYFVGEYQEKLIYLDPHLSQKSVENLYQLYQNGHETYEPKYFYYLDIKNMSPGFTMGFYFRSVEEYKYLKNALNMHSESKFNLFSFEKLGENKKIKKKNSDKKPEEIKFTEVIEDDFSVIDIEEEDC